MERQIIHNSKKNLIDGSDFELMNKECMIDFFLFANIIIKIFTKMTINYIKFY